MKRPSNPTKMAPVSANVLSVSPVEEDHTALGRIFDDAARGAAPSEMLWQLSRIRTLSFALTSLRQTEYAAAVCERDLRPGSWKELLASMLTLPNPPLLIVTSRHADEHLWAEALNLGAYDVLAKPFNPTEVTRVINLACLRWQRGAVIRRTVLGRGIYGRPERKESSDVRRIYDEATNSCC